MKRAINSVHPDLVGEASYATIPGTDAALYGSAKLEGPAQVEVRTYQTHKLTYTTGKLGLDDTGAIRVAFRLISDAGTLQTTDPSAPNYVTAKSSGEGRLDIKYDRNGGQRPWNEVLTIYQRGGYLRAGETIEITIGDTNGGSPGALMPTFVDGGRVFRVEADIQATGVFVPLRKNHLSIEVVAGPVHQYLAILPTLRRPGETFRLGVKAEDVWGNPTDQGPCKFAVSANLPVTGLPSVIDFSPDDGVISIDGLKCEVEGTLFVTLTPDGGPAIVAGPLVIRSGEAAHYWGDLHAQTGETVGTNSLEYYLDFARHKAFLDVTSHQANDFQIKEAFWKQLNEVTAAADDPGVFTVLPGYEWSGNTAVGGDHNVFYRTEGAQIYRCSHALVADRSDEANDAHDLTALYAKLRAEPVDAVMYAHVGGRYANIFYDHDSRIEAAVEIHSAWGTFEWLLTDGFPLRRRVGVVCNSDDHKGRPGASYPGASVFGAYGGLTCFVTDQNTRDSIFETIRRRHTYATTGPRVFIDLNATLPKGGTRFLRDPIVMRDTATEQVSRCTIGDIVRVNSKTVNIDVTVDAPIGIVSLELRAGKNTLRTDRTYDASTLGNRVRVLWSGAEYRGRGRNTHWRGRADIFNAKINRFVPVNRLNPEMPLRQAGSNSVVWNAVTTGNMMGFDAFLSSDQAKIAVVTNHGRLDCDVPNMGAEPIELNAGGLARKLSVRRLPDTPLPKQLSLVETVQIAEEGDTPIWICVTFEDGNQAWTSPIYFHRD